MRFACRDAASALVELPASNKRSELQGFVRRPILRNPHGPHEVQYFRQTMLHSGVKGSTRNMAIVFGGACITP
jgi:hypothetical protein